jgi:hypothetical protein
LMQLLPIGFVCTTGYRLPSLGLMPFALFARVLANPPPRRSAIGTLPTVRRSHNDVCCIKSKTLCLFNLTLDYPDTKGPEPRARGTWCGDRRPRLADPRRGGTPDNRKKPKEGRRTRQPQRTQPGLRPQPGGSNHGGHGERTDSPTRILANANCVEGPSTFPPRSSSLPPYYNPSERRFSCSVFGSAQPKLSKLKSYVSRQDARSKGNFTRSSLQCSDLRPEPGFF